MATSIVVPGTAGATVSKVCPTDTSDGAWLDTKALHKCLEAQINSTTYVQQISLYEAETVSKAREIAALHDQVAAEQTAVLMLKAETKTDRAEITTLGQQLKAWYHDPFIMACIGAAVGIAGTSALVLAVHP